MENVSKRTRVIAPLLAFALAFAFAQATSAQPAFAATDDLLQGGAIRVQDDAAAEIGYGVGAYIERAVITLDSTSLVYTGKELEPGFKVTLDGEELKGSADFDDNTADFWYFYTNNVDVNSATAADEDKPQLVVATFAEDDPYVYVRSVPFDITPANIKGAKVTATNEVYTGKALKPDTFVTLGGVSLTKGVDYTVSFKNNKKAGKAKIVVTGKGNYTGTATGTFKILKASIKKAKFTDVKDKVYTGKKLTPKMKVRYAGKTLKKGRDYTIKYKKNKNVGVATITIKGKGNLKGTQKVKFGILPRPISNKAVKVSVSDTTYTGSLTYPTVAVSYNGMNLVAGRDFNVRYSNNANASTATGRNAKVVISGKGNYSSSRTVTFKVLQRAISDSDVKVSWSNNSIDPVLTYNGRTLVKGTDFTYVLVEEKGDDKTSYKYTIYGNKNFTGQRTEERTV